MLQQLPQPVAVFMLYPNYRGMLFDDQPQTMRFDVTVTPPGGDFGRVKIRGALKDEGTGQQLSSQDFTASANFVAQIDGSGMQAGRAYQVVFSVVDTASGAVTYTYPAYRVSKVAGSARASMNVSVDAKNRLLVRGTPRFVLGVYDSGMGYGRDDVFGADLRNGGFAQYDRLRRLDPDSMTFAALLPQPDAGLWRDSADVLSTDPYPMFGAEPAGGYRMSAVADGARIARDAVKDSRPWMTVLQFFQFTSQGRWPTRAEMRNHAFMARSEEHTS